MRYAKNHRWTIPILLPPPNPSLCAVRDQEAEAKAKLKREMEARYLNPETQEYKKYREKFDAKKEKEKAQRNAKRATSRSAKRETDADNRRLRLENRRAKNGGVPVARGPRLT